MEGKNATASAGPGHRDPKDALRERVRNDFTYHTPPKEVTTTFIDLRETAKTLGLKMIDACPNGRELSSALTKLEEAVMHANAGIARQFPADKARAS